MQAKVENRGEAMPGGRVCKKTIVFSLSTFLCLQNLFFFAQHLCSLDIFCAQHLRLLAQESGTNVRHSSADVVKLLTSAFTKMTICSLPIGEDFIFLTCNSDLETDSIGLGYV